MNANIKLLIVLSVFLILFPFLPRSSFAATCFWSQVPCGPTLLYGWINCPASYVSGNTCYYGSYCSWPLFTGCCFNNADSNKPSCSSYCASYSGKWYWNYNGSPSCGSNGWVCNFSSYQCTASGCCDAACDVSKGGCYPNPNNSKCTSNTCSQTYYDYCSAKKLVEYDNDCTDDSTTVTDSCNNTCQSDCSCTNCSPDCGPPGTTTHCCKGVCGAECSDGETQSCGNCGTKTCQSDCTWGACVADASKCTGNCDTCSSTDGGSTYNCAASASLCTGNCDVCSGSGTSYNCSASASLCTGNCDICSGSGTSYNCAGSNSLCSNTDASCYCSGSGTSFNCVACSSGYTCSSYNCVSSTCSDSCDGYKLKDYGKNCSSTGGDCSVVETRYVGGACSVCPFNNDSCPSNFKDIIDSDCVVAEQMYVPENKQVKIRKKVSLLSGSKLTVKKGGKLILDGGSIVIGDGMIIIEK